MKRMLLPFLSLALACHLLGSATHTATKNGGRPDHTRTVLALPNDPFYARQASLAGINAPLAWDISTGGPIKIAVIDTGVDFNHPDLAGNIWDTGNLVADKVNNDSCPMDISGHGTQVAGIIAARGNNGVGVTGVSWSSSILSVRAGDGFGAIRISESIAAIDFAVANGAKIINCSYGGSPFSALEYEAISHANDAGVLVVVAAGNFATNLDAYPMYPASYDLPNIIAVAATDEGGALLATSNYGRQTVHVAAPGQGIYTTKQARRSVFSENFDGAEDAKWTLNGWTKSGASFFSSPFSLAGGASAEALAVSPVLDLTGIRGCRLEFVVYGPAGAEQGSLYVETSTGGASGWEAMPLEINGQPCPRETRQECSRLGGATPGWVNVRADLGSVDDRPSVRIRFRYNAESPGAAPAYYIDNVTLTAACDPGSYPADSYETVSGTSFAAPHVSGLAALVWSAYPSMSALEVKDTILKNVSPRSALAPYVSSGGIVDAYKALKNPSFRQAGNSTPPETSKGSDGGGGGGGCFIATAAFGSAWEPEVQALRRLRDNVLAPSAAGREFIRIYYRYSPRLAAVISKSALLKTAARDALFPVVALSLVLSGFGPEAAAILLAAALAALSIAPQLRRTARQRRPAERFHPPIS